MLYSSLEVNMAKELPAVSKMYDLINGTISLPAVGEHPK